MEKEKKKIPFRLDSETYEYELIGVTVHTGTADGGHYYAFIRERTSTDRDKWYSFNDAEVKHFDPNHIASECFGGEMSSRTYDQVTINFLWIRNKDNSDFLSKFKHSNCMLILLISFKIIDQNCFHYQ